MSEPTPPTYRTTNWRSYRTTNWRSYNAALKQRGSLLIWFDPETQWLAAPSGRRGRSPIFTDAAIQACLTLKALFGLPLRQTTGLVASLLELAGLDWSVPDFSTLSRRQKGLNVAIPYRPGTGALHLLIDSTGIKAPSRQHPADAPAGQWRAKASGSPRNTGLPSRANRCLAGECWHSPREGARFTWGKVHLGQGSLGARFTWGLTRTLWKSGPSRSLAAGLEMRQCCPSCWARSPMTNPSARSAPPLVVCLQTTAGQRTVLMTPAPATPQSCHAAIAARSACAVIPARKNARPWLENTPGAQARNEILRATRRIGRTISRRWSGYHRRSLVETKMRCFKLLGERVMARDFDRQVAELQIRAAILNRFTALGTPQTQRVG